MKEFLQFNLPSKEIKENGENGENGESGENGENGENDTLKMEVEALKVCLRGIIYMAESGLHTKNEIAFARRVAEAKELCKL